MNTPEHYRTKTGYQHWDFARNAKLGYHLGNATKYIWRYLDKGTPVEDLDKAINFLVYVRDRLSSWEMATGLVSKAEQIVIETNLKDVGFKNHNQFQMLKFIMDIAQHTRRNVDNHNANTNLKDCIQVVIDMAVVEKREHAKWNPENIREYNYA